MSKQTHKSKKYIFSLQTKGAGNPEKTEKGLKKDRKQSKYTSEEPVAMETSIIKGTSLTQENFLWQI